MVCQEYICCIKKGEGEKEKQDILESVYWRLEEMGLLEWYKKSATENLFNYLGYKYDGETESWGYFYRY